MRKETIYGYGQPTSYLWYSLWRDVIARIVKSADIDSKKFKKGIRMIRAIDVEMKSIARNLRVKE